MTKTMCARVMGAMLLLGPSVPVVAEQGPPGVRPPVGPTGRPSLNLPSFAWWKSPTFQAEVGLTADQSERIDRIWEATRPELRQEWEELSRLEAKLSRMIQHDVDEAALSRQIDRVETARANANKTRSLMLVQMRKVLTEDQRVRLDAIHERWRLDVQRQRPPSADPGKQKDESARSK
jgi:Spy/CpxP family protein refolding chaperone